MKEWSRVTQPRHSVTPSLFQPSMPLAREYCCCAVPVVNAGIYFTLVTNTVLAVLVGALAIATPNSLSSATAVAIVTHSAQLSAMLVHP